MWIHILIFMVILGVFLAGKMGRLPPEAGNPEEKKLFIRIALTGNIIGMLLTFQSGGDKVYSSGYRMEKEETGAYEEKFMVSVDGKNPVLCMCRYRKKRRKNRAKSRKQKKN